MGNNNRLTETDIKLTVVICSHNPRPDYIRRTLDALRAQSLPKEQWELLLIDNASKFPLPGLCDLSWHPNGRHVMEPELGLACARARGMKELLSDLLVFVDDDNLLDESYLVKALEIGNGWPILGAWGAGAIIPEFELEPAEEFKGLMQFLAIRETAQPCWSNIYPCTEATPRGAGLCVRAHVAQAYRRMLGQTSIVMFGHRGNSLLGGEDNEIAYVACDQGLGMGIFPELRLTHLIPKERVSREYLLRLVEAIETSMALVWYKWKGNPPDPPVGPWGMLSVLKHRLVLRGLEWDLYLAGIRGQAAAKSIIAEAQARSSRRVP